MANKNKLIEAHENQSNEPLRTEESAQSETR